MHEGEDNFDSMTRSADDDFHKWALQDEFITEDIDVYEACESAWAEAKRQTAGKIASENSPVKEVIARLKQE